jgi:hypothetical protein
MRVVIRSRGLCVDADMRAYLTQALQRPLGASQRSVASVRAYFVGLKAPGGLGCRVVVKLARSGGAVIVTERCHRFYTLADRAARRAGAAVRRRLQRRQARRRRRGRAPLAA